MGGRAERRCLAPRGGVRVGDGDQPAARVLQPGTA
jgi:hypothetical protein